MIILIPSAVYAIINLFDNKLYVGSGVKVYARWGEHKTRLRANTHHNSLLQRAWNKYGEQRFKFQILESVCNPNDLIERETFWITLTNCTDKNIGYNFCKEGRNNLGVKRSKETCEKISKSNKGKAVPEERKLKISASLIGRKLSKERIDKLKRRKHSEETKAKMSKSRRKYLGTDFGLNLTQSPIIISQ